MEQVPTLEELVYDLYIMRLIARLESTEEPLAASEMKEMREFLKDQSMNATIRHSSRLKSIAAKIDPSLLDPEDDEGRNFRDRDIVIESL